MAISAEDKENITVLRAIRAPNLANLVEDVVTKKGQNEALDSAGRKFTELATPGSILKLRGIDNQLENPKTLEDVKALLNRNPAGFEKVLPQIFDDPKQTSRLISEQLALSPAAAPAKPAVVKPEAVVLTVPKKEEAPAATPSISPRKPAAPPAPQNPRPAAAPKVEPVAAAAGAALATPPKESNPASVSAPAKPNESTGMAGFMDFLSKQEKNNPEIVNDFATFMNKIETNKVPEVTQAYQALVGGKSSPAESEAALNQLKKQVESQPEFFANMNKMLDTNPGLASKIVSVTGDPKAGMTYLAGYSNIAYGGIGQLLNGFLDMLGIKGGLDGLVGSLLGAVGDKFKGGSLQKLIGQSNNGGRMTAQANEATGASQSDGVTLYDRAGNKEELTPQQLAQRDAATTGKPSPTNPSADNGLQQQLGMTPKISGV